MTGTLYISCGLPGSGKSTFLADTVDESEIIVSRDEIRFSILKEGEEYFSHEIAVFNTFVNTIKYYLELGYNVYADATHLNSKSRGKLYYALVRKGCVPKEVVTIYFDVPIDICIARNEFRKGTKRYVPPRSIYQMNESLFKPDKKFEKYINETYTVDQDGEVLWEQ